MLGWLRWLMSDPPADPIAWGNGPQNTKVDEEILYDPGEAEIVFVFIHDIAEDCRDTWRVPDSDKFWPVELFAKMFPRAYMVAYGYDASAFKTIPSMFDQDILTQKANDLINMFPLVIDPGRPTSPPVTDPRRNTNTPLIFFAHGYGGLIYEKAIEILIRDLFEIPSSDEEQTPVLKNLRRHRAVLFGTPHFPAGLAEWAIISATRLGIVSGVNAQTYDWTECEQYMDHFKNMYNTFRNFCDGLSVKQLGLGREHAADFELTQGREIKVVGCFATLPLPNSNLILSPEWSFLPNFMPIAINDNHFGMTRFASATKTLKFLSQFVEKLDKITTVTADIGRHKVTVMEDDEPLEEETPYALLRQFGIIFLIDDSASMESDTRWDETRMVLEYITTICTQHGLDGIDIKFLNHERPHQGESPSHSYHNVRDKEHVRQIFDHVRPNGGTCIGLRLRQILENYIEDYEKGCKKGDNVPPINIITITDGHSDDNVQEVILWAANYLDSIDAPPHQVGLQFFRVGNERKSWRYLTSLRQMCISERFRDIMDVSDSDDVLTPETVLRVVTRSFERRNRGLDRP